MNSTGTDDRADEQLRALLAQVDPTRELELGSTDHLLDRLRTEVAEHETPGSSYAAESSSEASTTSPEPAAPAHEPPPAQRQSWLRRHWEGSLLVAAGVAALALAAPTVLPGVSGSDDATDQTASSIAVSDGAATGELELPGELGDPGEGGTAEDTASAVRGDEGLEAPPAGSDAQVGAAVGSADVTDDSLVRSASLLVGTDEIQAERDAFVATVLALGGRVTSETVVTEDSRGGAALGADVVAGEDLGMPYSPYPWYPTGPGVWLAVEVPADQFEEAVAAARSTGEVVQMQQSSYDVGTQIADVDARVAALEASLARLTDLLGQAEGVGEVIQLEQAIANRQSELDALRARQRELANQTEMSRVSLTLMSPEDARGSVDPGPQPDQTWWESFLAGLDQFWNWLGSALLIVSPLLIAMGIIWWARRRRAGSRAPGSQPDDGSPGPTDPSDVDPDAQA